MDYDAKIDKLNNDLIKKSNKLIACQCLLEVCKSDLKKEREKTAALEAKLKLAYLNSY